MSPVNPGRFNTYAHLYVSALKRAGEAMDKVMGKPDNVLRLPMAPGRKEHVQE